MTNEDNYNIKNWSTCSGEVSLSVDSLAVLEVPEEYDPYEGIAGDEGEHAHDNEEALVYRHSAKVYN